MTYTVEKRQEAERQTVGLSGQLATGRCPVAKNHSGQPAVSSAANTPANSFKSDLPTEKEPPVDGSAEPDSRAS